MDAAVAASGLAAADWLAIFTHFLSLSLLAIGGAITTARRTCTAIWSRSTLG